MLIDPLMDQNVRPACRSGLFSLLPCLCIACHRLSSLVITCSHPHPSVPALLQVQHLSGGELQRVAMALCLGKPADIYLVDEPSAYLDSEQRLSASKVLRNPCPGW